MLIKAPLQTFRSHMKRRAEDGTLDAAGVISRECYLHWLQTKLAQESDDEARKFHRTLTNHVSGVDGRSPFDPEEEAAILVQFRKRQPWPCFPPHMADVGRKYRSKGFHEKQQLAMEKQQRADALALASPSATQRASPVPVEHLPQQLKPMSGTTPLSTSLYHNAAQQLQRPIPADNLEELLGALSLQDRMYAQDVSRTVVANFSTPAYSLEDWRTISSIFRFMVLARTNKATLDLSANEQLAAARRLCEHFVQNDDKETVVMVFDPTAKTYAERAITQNDYSLRTIGPVVRNYYARGVDGSELYSTVLAVSAAYSTPGRSFKVTNQKHWCVDGAVHAFDMSYYMDPESLLFVVWGKLPPDDVAAAITPREGRSKPLRPLDMLDSESKEEDM